MVVQKQKNKTNKQKKYEFSKNKIIILINYYHITRDRGMWYQIYHITRDRGMWYQI